MRKLLSVIWIVVCLLSACDGQTSHQTIEPATHMPQPSSTATVTPTLIPTQTLIPTFPATPTFPPYPTKSFILEYHVEGNHGIFANVFEYSEPILVLYSDGQLVITGEIYRETTLSSDEIDKLLSQLEEIGFFSLVSNRKHDPTDPLYSFIGNQYQELMAYDGLSYCVSVVGEKENRLCAYEPLKEALISGMKKTLQFLDEYAPKNLSAYRSDRILLHIEKGRSSSLDTQLQEIAWSKSFPSLETSSWKDLYVKGDLAPEIFALFDYSSGFRVFTENGIEYTVFIRPVLPHEVIVFP